MSQLFKHKINKDMIIHFILKYCQNEKKNEYLFNTIAYKKMIYDNALENIVEELKKCYHKSKLFYIERDMTYKNFLTILRQVCKYLNISYDSNIVYNKSKYTIHYTIFLDNHVDISNNNIHDISLNVTFY